MPDNHGTLIYSFRYLNFPLVIAQCFYWYAEVHHKSGHLLPFFPERGPIIESSGKV